MQKAFTLYSLKKRILAIVIAISFIFSALIIRLFIIQIINGSSLQAKATDQWTRDLKIIAQRGKVVDRTGSALAVSYTTYNVYVRSREVQNTSVVANILSSELSLSFEKIYTKIKNNNASEVLIKMQVEGEVVEKIYNHNLKGVYFAETANRYYPYGNLLSQVLGFISIDNVGQSGIEADRKSVV